MEEHQESKEEQKVETRTIKIPAFFSRLLPKEDHHNDWHFGLAFTGMVLLLYLNFDFIVLAAWMIAWFLFLSHLEK